MQSQMNWSDGNTFPGRSGHSSQGVGVSTGGKCSSERRNDLSHASVLLWLVLAIAGITVRCDGLARLGFGGRSCKLVRACAGERQLYSGMDWLRSIGVKSRLHSLFSLPLPNNRWGHDSGKIRTYPTRITGGIHSAQNTQSKEVRRPAHRTVDQFSARPQYPQSCRCYGEGGISGKGDKGI